ncbi:MAG TPA: YfiR family protein [Planctomycetota bacterium]|nr:YfiR family protein [Planctomycetota bacterium]
MSRSRAGRAARLALAAGLALALSARPAVVEAEVSPEYEVKAAFLYNFTKFVEWPAEKFVEWPVERLPERVVAGKAVGGRAIEARRYKRAEDAGGAHVLFIASSEASRLRATFKALAGAHVLTVGDLERFAERGGVVGFVTEESKVRFTVNTAAAARAELALSSKLLKLARIVEETPGG